VFIAQVSLQMHKFPLSCATNLPVTENDLASILCEIPRPGFNVEGMKRMGYKK
jgi:hypothetical protein